MEAMLCFFPLPLKSKRNTNFNSLIAHPLSSRDVRRQNMCNSETPANVCISRADSLHLAASLTVQMVRMVRGKEDLKEVYCVFLKTLPTVR